jgi:MFS family permease
MPNRKGLDLSRVIIYAALIVTAARYAGAFLASDLGEVTGILSSILTAFMVVSGFGMGILDVIGIGYISDAWRQSLPRTGRKPGARFFILTGFLISLMAIGVGILAPFTVARVHKLSIAITLPGPELYFWAVLVNLSPYLIVSGLMVATSNILTVPAVEMVPVDNTAYTARTPDALSEPARVDAKPVFEVCAICEKEYKSKAAHYRWNHPELTIAARRNGKAE